MSPRVGLGAQRERAFRTYLELLRMGDWLWGWVGGSLDIFDLTVAEFRLLETLRGGPLRTDMAAERLEWGRQSVHKVADRLAKRGLLERKNERQVAVELRGTLPRARRKTPREGRMAGTLRLTREGATFIAHVCRKHSNWVKATMRALDGRQQETLRRLCKKLREGDVEKFFREIRRRIRMRHVEGRSG